MDNPSVGVKKLTSNDMKDGLRWGWETFKKYPGFIILVLVIYEVVSMIPNFFAQEDRGSFLYVIIALAVYAVSLMMQMGTTKMILNFKDGKMPQLKELIRTENLLEYFLGNLLYGLIVLGGFILLIVPGIIWSLKFSLTPMLIIDKGMKPLDALKKSGQMTDGIKWDLLFLGIILGALNLAGALLFLVGLLITIPVTMFAYVHVYRKVLERTVTA